MRVHWLGQAGKRAGGKYKAGSRRKRRPGYRAPFLRLPPWLLP